MPLLSQAGASKWKIAQIVDATTTIGLFGWKIVGTNFWSIGLEKECSLQICKSLLEAYDSEGNLQADVFCWQHCRSACCCQVYGGRMWSLFSNCHSKRSPVPNVICRLELELLQCVLDIRAHFHSLSAKRNNQGDCPEWEMLMRAPGYYTDQCGGILYPTLATQGH